MKPKMTATLIGGAVLAALTASIVQAAEMRLKPNELKIINLSDDPKAIIVSNPEFLSVQLLSKRKILLQGLAFGHTKLTVLNKEGEKLANLDINILPRNGKNILRVWNKRGTRETYLCNPECAPSYTMHDDMWAVSRLESQVSSIQDLAETANRNIYISPKALKRRSSYRSRYRSSYKFFYFGR